MLVSHTDLSVGQHSLRLAVGLQYYRLGTVRIDMFIVNLTPPGGRPTTVDTVSPGDDNDRVRVPGTPRQPQVHVLGDQVRNCLPCDMEAGSDGLLLPLAAFERCS